MARVVTTTSIAKSLELQLLRTGITHEEVGAGCARAAAAHLAAVCVHPVHVGRARAALRASDTRVCAAIGFPGGQDVVETRRDAATRAAREGAHELAIMLDHSVLRAGDAVAIVEELAVLLGAVSRQALESGRASGHVTIVVETMLIDLVTLAPLFEQLHESPAGFVQTSTGAQPRQLTEEHVRRLRQALPSDIGIKAVGGISDHGHAVDLIAAGAARVGTGSAIAIVEQERQHRQVASTS